MRFCRDANVLACRALPRDSRRRASSLWSTRGIGADAAAWWEVAKCVQARIVERIRGRALFNIISPKAKQALPLQIGSAE